jgi:hypothetical protein
MPTPLSASIARFVARCFVFALSIAPAAALEVKEVPSVVGMAPKDALEKLELEGFKDFLLRLDGVEKTRAEIESAGAVARWTSPPEWMTADTLATLEVGFETYVYVADHIGADASNAAAEARRIGYVLVEGDPASGTPIAATDDRTVESYHPSSPTAGAVVAAGAHVGVIMSAPLMPGLGVTGALVVGAVVGVVVGAAGAALLMKSKA